MGTKVTTLRVNDQNYDQNKSTECLLLSKVDNIHKPYTNPLSQAFFPLQFIGL